MLAYQKLTGVIVTILLVFTLMGCGMNNLGNSVIGEGSGSGELVRIGEKTFQQDTFDIISVKAEAMAIYIQPSTDDKATVELLVDDTIKNKFSFDVSIKSSTLDIKIKEKSEALVSINDQKDERRLNISLPSKVYEQLSIQNEFGLVEIEKIEQQQLNIFLNAGSISLNEVSGAMKLQVEAGQIEVNKLILEDDLYAKVEAGEIEINLQETPASAKFDLATELGEVEVNLEGIDYEVDSTNKKVGTIGSGESKTIEAKNELGNVVIN